MIDGQYSSYCFIASELSIEKKIKYSRHATSRSRSFTTTHFVPVLAKGFYQTEPYSLHVVLLIRI
jgi:hypothetical protein